jgi:hypothetical protein
VTEEEEEEEEEEEDAVARVSARNNSGLKGIRRGSSPRKPAEGKEQSPLTIFFGY